MSCRLHDPYGHINRDGVNVLMAGSIRLKDMDGWDITKRLICFEDRQTGKHLEQYKSMAPMFLILDSGAFSAWTKGAVIDIDEYVDFIIKHSSVISQAANLDVIPGRKGDRAITQEQNEKAALEGWRNYLYILNKLRWKGRSDLVSKVMPIHHQGEDLDHLKRMVDHGATYIGVSPSNDAKTPQRIKYLDQVFSYLSGQGDISTHGYAVTSETLMSAYPWTTVDSISWIQIAGFGYVKTPFGMLCFSDDPRSLNNKDNLRVSYDDNGEIVFGNSRYQSMRDEICSYFEDRMLDMGDLLAHYWFRAKANILYFQEFERDNPQRHRNVSMSSIF